MRTFVGTGLIGAAMARASAARGEPTRVWNRTASRAAALQEDGCEVRLDLAEAVAGADVIHLALPADPQVDAVLPAVLAAISPEAVVVDHSTTSPEGAARRLAEAAGRGVWMLHAPIFMSPHACLSGSGTMVVSGSSEVFAAVEAKLAVMTGDLVFAGPDGHEAATLKLVGNGMILAINAGLADGMTLAAKQGVSPQTVLELFDHLDLGVSLKGRGGRMARGDRSVSWTLSMAAKDQGLMMAAAGREPLPLLEAVGQRMKQLIDEGEGQQDLSILARDVPRH